MEVTGLRKEFCDDIIQREEEALVAPGSGGAYHSTFNNTYGQSRGSGRLITLTKKKKKQ